MSTPFRLSIVPGVTPGKWVSRYEERNPGRVVRVSLLDEHDQLGPLRAGDVEMAFVRLPVDTAGLHLIPLYAEVPVAVVSKEHPASVMESIVLADVEDELLDASSLPLHQAIEVVAGGAGVVVVPMSVARLQHRRDVAAVPVSDLPETRIGLAWPTETDDPWIEDFIGVVRGRTAGSSRGRPSESSRGRPSGRRRRG